MAGSSVLAFIGPDGNIWTMAANGGSKRRITTDGTPDVPYAPPSWSRDGLRLMSVRRDPPAVVAFDLPVFTPRMVATSRTVLATWGPGTAEITLAVADSQRGVITIEVVTAHARRGLAEVPWKVRAAEPPGFPTRAALLPSANDLIWSPRRDFLMLIWPDVLSGLGAVVDLTTTTNTVIRDIGDFVPALGEAERVMSLHFIDDDTLFACVQAQGRGGAARIRRDAIEWVRGAEALAAQRSPDQGEIYYVQRPTRSPSLWRVPAMGGIPEEMLTGRLSYAPPDRFQNCVFWGLPSFAPDGGLMAVDQLQVDGQFGTPLYQAMETIWLATPEGREPRMLGLGRHVAWQPVPA
jgi:hypothetical protein